MPFLNLKKFNPVSFFLDITGLKPDTVVTGRRFNMYGEEEITEIISSNDDKLIMIDRFGDIEISNTLRPDNMESILKNHIPDLIEDDSETEFYQPGFDY